MAGFMSGFGKAFSESFRDSRQASAEKEQDMMRMKFTEYTRRQEAYEKTKSEQRKQVRLAKSLVEGKNPEAWSKVYDWLASGMDEKTVAERIEDGTFTIQSGTPEGTTAAEGPEVPGTPQVNGDNEDLSQAAAGAVDADMKANGMETPADGGVFAKEGAAPEPVAAPTATDPSAPTEVDPAAPVDPMAPPVAGEDSSLNLFGVDRGTPESRVDDKMAEVTGKSAEEINRIMSEDPEFEQLPGVEGKMISWTPGKGKDLAWEVKSIESAMTNLKRAEVTKDPVQIANAQAVLDGQIAAVAIQADAVATAKGEKFTPKAAAIMTGGKFSGWAINTNTTGSGAPVWVDPKTQRQLGADDVFPMDKGMIEITSNIAKETAKESQEYTMAAENFASMTLDYGELVNLVRREPRAVSAIGDAAKYIDTAVRNVKGAIDLVATRDATNSEVNSAYTWEGLEGISKQTEAIAAKVKTFNGNNLEKLALEATLADAIATRLAYAYGLTQGQSGRSVAITEFDNFKRNVLANGNPDAIQEGASKFLISERDRLSAVEKNLNTNNTYMRHFEETYQFPSPFRPAAPLDSIVNANPKVKAVYDAFANMEAEAVKRQAAETQQATDPRLNGMPERPVDAPPGYEPIGRSPEGKIIYRDSNGRNVVEE